MKLVRAQPSAPADPLRLWRPVDDDDGDDGSGSQSQPRCKRQHSGPRLPVMMVRDEGGDDDGAWGGDDVADDWDE